jgi:hypothetical protein
MKAIFTGRQARLVLDATLRRYDKSWRCFARMG